MGADLIHPEHINIIVNQKDELKTQRAKMLDFIYDCKDGRACQRIIEFIKEAK